MGQPVWVRDLPAGSTWLPGVIVQARGSDRFQVELQNNRKVDRHIDHIRGRVPSQEPEKRVEPLIPTPSLLTDDPQPGPPPPQCDEPPVVPVDRPLTTPVDPSPPLRRSARNSRPPERFM